jgi:xanthosine phosphorylase
MSQDARTAAQIVRARVPDRRPRVGIVLGSGLGKFASHLEDPIAIDYRDLPGFPQPSVEGHAGRLIVGRVAGTEVACLQGRVHLYEGHPASAVVPLVRTLKLIGCDIYFATNAAGALDPDATPGSLMMIVDHINMQGQNPLSGANDDSFGPRFPAMSGAYDVGLQERLRVAARAGKIGLREGTYLALLGPNFETPAEIRMCARFGANAVGMSTVPEVIVARHCGMRVAAVSVLTNLGAGLADEVLSHEQTLEFAGRAADDLTRLLKGFLGGLADDKGEAHGHG